MCANDEAAFVPDVSTYANLEEGYLPLPQTKVAGSAYTIWFDPVNAVGLFEPVGTHPDFQGQGLGKAVMAEGLRRMKAAGMRRAILGFDPNNADTDIFSA